MKFDRVTKVSLILIAVFLGIIALRPILEPAKAQANPGETLARMQVSFENVGGRINAFVYDPKDGSVWRCFGVNQEVTYLGRLPELTKPAK